MRNPLSNLISRTRHIAPLLLLLLLFLPVQADYPTMDALRDTIIPVNDPVDLARRLRGVDDIPPLVLVARQIGDQETFHIGDASTTEAELRAISQTAYLWVENGIPIPQAELDELGAAFDTIIYPGVRALFGSEDTPGIDGDPRLHILFARRLGPGTAAYFARRHIFPLAVMPASNQREMFFVNMDAFPLNIGSDIMEDTLAHEFQHMIQEHQDANEDVWLNEGFSTFTETYLGYDGALGHANTFLLMPGTQLNDFGGENMPRSQNYGAGLLFVTYIYERFGIDGVKALSADPANGLTAVENLVTSLTGQTLDQFFADWVTANIVQDKTIADGRYGYDLIDLPFEPATRAIFDHRVVSTVSQYATDYYVLSSEPLPELLTLSLELPETAQLVPADAASGQQAWYSNRGDVSDMRLTRAFDLSGVERATLNYNLWYAIEEGWDYGYVLVSTDDGEHWDILSTANTTDYNPQDNAYGPGYTGESGGWLAESVSLDAYAGQEILLRFELITDDAVNLAGMLIDDVAIPEIGYRSDFEADDGGWMGEGWFLTDNVLPQSAWVQVIQFRQGESGDVTIDRWQIPAEGMTYTANIAPDTERVVIAVSPFAPVTTVPVTYTLRVE